MNTERVEWESRLYNRLTAIRLANELLVRRSDLTPYQHSLVKMSQESAEALTMDLAHGLGPAKAVERRRRPAWTKLYKKPIVPLAAALRFGTKVLGLGLAGFTRRSVGPQLAFVRVDEGRRQPVRRGLPRPATQPR